MWDNIKSEIEHKNNLKNAVRLISHMNYIYLEELAVLGQWQ